VKFKNNNIPWEIFDNGHGYSIYDYSMPVWRYNDMGRISGTVTLNYLLKLIKHDDSRWTNYPDELQNTMMFFRALKTKRKNNVK
jgi:hypothetical protein